MEVWKGMKWKEADKFNMSVHKSNKTVRFVMTSKINGEDINTFCQIDQEMAIEMIAEIVSGFISDESALDEDELRKYANDLLSKFVR